MNHLIRAGMARRTFHKTKFGTPGNACRKVSGTPSSTNKTNDITVKTQNSDNATRNNDSQQGFCEDNPDLYVNTKEVGTYNNH